jgi:CRP-like cAMP-binding protein
MLSQSQLDSISQMTTWRDFARGEVIVEAGNRLPGLFIVVRGRIRATFTNTDGQLIDVFEANHGDIFGESIANGINTSEFRNIAIEDTSCMIVDPEHFRRLLYESPRFAREIAQISESRSIRPNDLILRR